MLVVKGDTRFWEEMDGGLCGYLGDGSEPAEVEERGGAGCPGEVADEEGGLREVEFGGDGLHPPLVRGVVVFEEAHRGGVALEGLGREGVHLRRDHDGRANVTFRQVRPCE